MKLDDGFPSYYILTVDNTLDERMVNEYLISQKKPLEFEFVRLDMERLEKESRTQGI